MDAGPTIYIYATWESREHTVHLHTWYHVGFLVMGSLDHLAMGRGDEIRCTECRTPAEARPLLCAPGERFVSSPEIIWQYASPMIRVSANLVRRAKVLWFKVCSGGVVGLVPSTLT